MRIIRPDRQEQPIRDGVVILEEVRNYLLTLPKPELGPATEALLGDLRLEWNSAQQGFDLPIGHWVGTLPLQVRSGSERREIRVEVVPRPEKLNPAAWSSLLAELDAWLPGVTVGHEGGTHGSVSTAGAEAPLLASALIPLLPPLRRALAALVEAPQERSRENQEDVPIHAVRQADGETLRWLMRHPETAAALRPSSLRGSAESLSVPLVPQRIPAATLDHPANRYLAWLVRRVLERIDSCASQLEKFAAQTGSVSDGAGWCAARAQELRDGARPLEHLRQRSFLRSLRPGPASEAALSTFQDDPLYARFHRLVRPFLSPRFQLESSQAAPGAAVRPSYGLYELWTFLAVERLLQRGLGEAKWSRKGFGGITRLGSTGAGAVSTALLPDGGRLGLYFNPTFRGYLSRGSRERFSLSGERRPDLTVTWMPASGPGTWICLDAKYRVAPSAVADAFESLHIYRDALVDGPFGGHCRAAWLLVPAQDPACTPWFEPGFLADHGMGVARLTPGEPLPRAFGRAVLDRLGIPSAAE